VPLTSFPTDTAEVPPASIQPTIKYWQFFRAIMPTYIMLGRLTTQAKRNQAEALKARDQLWSEYQKKGVKVTPYMTIGPYDVVNIVESPTEELAMQFLMAAGATGNIDTTTLRAFTAQEMEKIRAR
jgi:uncharacterized protein with GYD domain